MKYKATILNVAAGIYLLCCLVYTVIKYDILSDGEGWGVVGMAGLMSIGLLALVVDLVIQLIRYRR